MVLSCPDMKDELIGKIQNVLDRPIAKEMQVVYLLVELRKLMDRAKYEDSVLRMFCNWIVHTGLRDKREGSTLILSEFDDLMIRVFDRQKTNPPLGHVSFGAFREALARCFETFGLSATFIKDKAAYKRFVKLYALVVAECPIVYTASKTPLKYIKEVELRGIGDGPIIKKWPVLSWRLTLNTGKTMNWGFPME